jgi:hypothetical protein
VQFYAWAEFPQTLHTFRVRQPHTNSLGFIIHFCFPPGLFYFFAL